MPSFEILAYIFTCLSVFDSRKGSSYALKTSKNISVYFKRKHVRIYSKRFLLFVTGSARNDVHKPEFFHYKKIILAVKKTPGMILNF